MEWCPTSGRPTSIYIVATWARGSARPGPEFPRLVQNVRTESVTRLRAYDTENRLSPNLRISMPPFLQAVVAPTPPQAGVATSASDAAAIYRALTAQRNVLSDQIQDVQRLRSNLVDELSEPNQTAAGKASIEARIANADARIADLDKQIAQSDAAVAAAAAVPGATTRPPPPLRTGPPEEVFVLGAIFLFVVALPMSIAFARRIWRKSARVEVRLPPEMSDRMESLERGMEAIALEVERIGEGQRFVTQTLAGRALGAGAAEPVPVRQRDRAEEKR